MTEAQTAGVKRLKEMIEVLNTGDYATIRAYFEANSDPRIGFVECPRSLSSQPRLRPPARDDRT